MIVEENLEGWNNISVKSKEVIYPQSKDDKAPRDIYSPSQPLRADQAVFAHTMMAPAPSWQEGPSL